MPMNMLQGTNLDSVQRSEIRVFVGREPCNIEVPSSEQVRFSEFHENRAASATFSNLAAVLLTSTRST